MNDKKKIDMYIFESVDIDYMCEIKQMKMYKC